MNKIEKKITLLEEHIKEQETEKIIKKQEVYFINEMKKIGIEKLPYSYSALRRFIDAETMNVHYNKHYKGYVDKLNAALSQGNFGDLELEQIVKSIKKYNKTIQNNAGGAFNHALFWKMLTPKQLKPNNLEVYKKIEKDFGNFRTFVKKFESVAKERFGSGWAWLVLTKGGKLKIMSTQNQENPLMNTIEDGGYPLLGLDLWEHAYYLKYKNKRDEYIKNFWKAVNWEFVNKLYKMKVETKLNESKVLGAILSENVAAVKSPNSKLMGEIFNINPDIKKMYATKIREILKDVYSDFWKEKSELSDGQYSGVYNLETEGRSVINKLDTNYSTFAILVDEINNVLTKAGKTNLNFNTKNKEELVKQLSILFSILDKYKYKIFAQDSPILHRMIKMVSETHVSGEKRESSVTEKLKDTFGKENVDKVGELGNTSDMFKGIDVVIKKDGKEYTGQIKPFGYIKDDGKNVRIFFSANAKYYNNVDWLIFQNNKQNILIYDNKGVKISNGQYLIPSENLLFTID
jgi:Fe-Mn family superoxide dismutase